jgi:hypothetical protein
LQDDWEFGRGASEAEPAQDLVAGGKRNGLVLASEIDADDEGVRINAPPLSLALRLFTAKAAGKKRTSRQRRLFRGAQSERIVGHRRLTSIRWVSHGTPSPQLPT